MESAKPLNSRRCNILHSSVNWPSSPCTDTMFNTFKFQKRDQVDHDDKQQLLIVSFILPRKTSHLPREANALHLPPQSPSTTTNWRASEVATTWPTMVTAPMSTQLTQRAFVVLNSLKHVRLNNILKLSSNLKENTMRLFREIITVYCQNHTKHINTLNDMTFFLLN